MLRKSQKQLTARFLHRTVLFLVFFSVGLVCFYIFGNFQEFLDSTQSLILSVLTASALASSMLAAILFFLELYFVVLKKRTHYVPLIFVSALLLVFSVAISVVSSTIIILSRGF